MINYVRVCPLYCSIDPMLTGAQRAAPSFLKPLVLVAALVLPSFAVLVRVRMLLMAAAVGLRVVPCPLLLSMARCAELALRLLASSSAGCALFVVVASSAVWLAARRGAPHDALLIDVVRAGAETSSGRLTTGYHLGLVAAALQLRGEALPSRCSLLLVQVAAGVEVSVAVGLAHRLALRVTVDVDRCHCSLFHGRLAAIRMHPRVYDTHVCLLLDLSLSRLLASRVGERD